MRLNSQKTIPLNLFLLLETVIKCWYSVETEKLLRQKTSHLFGLTEYLLIYEIKEKPKWKPVVKPNIVECTLELKIREFSFHRALRLCIHIRFLAAKSRPSGASYFLIEKNLKNLQEK